MEINTNPKNKRQDPMSAIFFVDLHLTGPTAPPTPAIVDLGAGMSIVNWRAAGQVGVTPSSPGVIKNQMQVRPPARPFFVPLDMMICLCASFLPLDMRVCMCMYATTAL